VAATAGGGWRGGQGSGRESARGGRAGVQQGAGKSRQRGRQHTCVCFSSLTLAFPANLSPPPLSSSTSLAFEPFNPMRPLFWVLVSPRHLA